MRPSRSALLTCALLGLSACSGVVVPHSMPPATGAPETVTLSGRDYTVTRTAVASEPGGELMRIYRPHGAAFDYSDGQTARDVAKAFCKGYHRGLSPWAMGMFEPTGAWAFPGGCA